MSPTCNHADFHCSATFKSPRREHYPYQFLLLSQAGQFDCLDNDLANLLASARDDHSIFIRGVRLLLDDSRGSLNNDDPLKDVPCLPQLSSVLKYFLNFESVVILWDFGLLRFPLQGLAFLSSSFSSLFSITACLLPLSCVSSSDAPY